MHAHEQLFDVPILALRDETRAGDVRTFVLERPRGFAFQPGQYVWFSVSARDAYPMAIASGVDDEHLEFSIRRGSGTAELFDKAVGEHVTISGPSGTAFPLHDVDPGQPVVLVAGGTGVTPIRSTLRSLHPEHPIRVVVGARSGADLLYLDELLARPGVTLTVEDATEWRGAVGRVTEHLTDVDPEAIAFVCGPDPMMVAVRDALLTAGLASSRVFLSVQALDAAGAVVGPVLSTDDPVLVETLS